VYEHVDSAIVESGLLFRDMITGCGRDMGLVDQQDRLQAVLTAELAR
jgi:hypothetical protein